MYTKTIIRSLKSSMSTIGILMVMDNRMAKVDLWNAQA